MRALAPALASERVRAFLNGTEPAKVIYVPGRLVNVVAREAAGTVATVGACAVWIEQYQRARRLGRSDMVTVEVHLSDELVSLLRESERSVEDAALEMIVLELYRRGSLTSSRAAELLGSDRFSFIQYASGLGIPFIDMTEEEWDEEARLIESHRRGSGLSPTSAR